MSHDMMLDLTHDKVSELMIIWLQKQKINPTTNIELS